MVHVVDVAPAGMVAEVTVGVVTSPGTVPSVEGTPSDWYEKPGPLFTANAAARMAAITTVGRIKGSQNDHQYPPVVNPRWRAMRLWRIAGHNPISPRNSVTTMVGV